MCMFKSLVLLVCLIITNTLIKVKIDCWCAHTYTTNSRNNSHNCVDSIHLLIDFTESISRKD